MAGDDATGPALAAFPSFDAERLRRSLPPAYFGTPAPQSQGGRRIRHGPNHLGRNGAVLRRQSGIGPAGGAASRQRRAWATGGVPSPTGGPRSGLTGGDGLGAAADAPPSTTDDRIEFEYRKSKLSRPRELEGGVRNILSEVVLRREVRALTNVKRGLPSEEELAESQQVQTIQAFFRKKEPDGHGRCRHSAEDVRRMVAQAGGFEALCAALEHQHGESPLHFGESQRPGIEAPCPPCTSHGAPIRQPFGQAPGWPSTPPPAPPRARSAASWSACSRRCRPSRACCPASASSTAWARRRSCARSPWSTPATRVVW
jgi:hypothetical protein